MTGAFLRRPIPRPIRDPVKKSKSEKVKFVDDGTVANYQNYHLVQITLYDLTISCRKSTKNYLNIEFPSNNF